MTIQELIAALVRFDPDTHSRTEVVYAYRDGYAEIGDVRLRTLQDTESGEGRKVVVLD